MVRLSDIDLRDLDVFAQRVPHDWFALLRREAPVYRHPQPNGRGFWVISRHEDVADLNHDWARNSSARERGGILGLNDDAAPEQRARADEVLAGRMMPTMDPPEHTAFRKLVSRGFTPRMIGALEDGIRERAVDIIDKALTMGDCDFVVDAAAELPLQAIAELMGIPQAHRHKVFDWSNRLIGSQDPEYEIPSEQSLEAAVEIFAYAGELVAERRACPRADIVTTLISAEIGGEQLSETDFNLFFMNLAVAGNETTRNAISHGLWALTEHPDQYDLLVEDPGLAPSATEEILRWASPVFYFRRNVTEGFTLRGESIERGDRVTLWYVSANRDEAVFEDPFRFDIQRTPNPHQAFGGGGPHFCLGASLARLEIRVFFEELAARVRRVEPLGPPVRLRSNFINGIKHLPVRLHRRHP